LENWFATRKLKELGKTDPKKNNNPNLNFFHGQVITAMCDFCKYRYLCTPLLENCFATRKFKELGKGDTKKSTTLTCIFFMDGFTAGIARRSATSADRGTFVSGE
jgi:hypothetical protein